MADGGSLGGCAVNEVAKKFRGEKIKPQVLTEQVSKVLTEAILDGSLAPGERLIETDLQNKLGVSRSPLREAFRDLEKKGLLTIVPRRGTFVRDISRKDLEENFPVRASLEGLAAREAYHRMTNEELGQMASALEGMREAGEGGDAEGYRQNHLQFHEAFIESCGNKLLMDLLRTLRVHRLWYLVSFKYHRRDINMALAEHQSILDMFSSPETDPNELEELVRSHIEDALEKLFGKP
jgi:DNA-binding GntR family transcriptional regulator